MKTFSDFIKQRENTVSEGWFNAVTSAIGDLGRTLGKDSQLGGIQKQLKQTSDEAAKMLEKAYDPMIAKANEMAKIIDETSAQVKSAQDTAMQKLQNITTSKGGQAVINPADMQELQKVQNTIYNKTQKALANFNKIKEELFKTYHLAQENKEQLAALTSAAQQGIQSQRYFGRGGIPYAGGMWGDPTVQSGVLPNYAKKSAASMYAKGGARAAAAKAATP